VGLIEYGIRSTGNRFKPKVTGINADDAKIGLMKNLSNNTKTSQALARGIGESLDLVGDVADILGALSYLGNSMWGGMFPAASTLLSSDTFKDSISRGIRAQIEVFRDYNRNMKDTNTRCSNDKDRDCPYLYLQYPLVAGPLDMIGMNDKGYRGDVYYNQTKQRTMIEAVMENILRDTTSKYQRLLVANLGQSLYDSTLRSTTTTLAKRAYTSFLQDDYYDLYGVAFEKVCSFHGGVTYVDHIMMGPGSNCSITSNIAGQCKYTDNKKRYQCGYTSSNCNAWSNNWPNNPSMSYAEYFSPTDILQYTANIKDVSDPGQSPYAAMGFTDFPNNTDYSNDSNAPNILVQKAFRTQGACIITSSAIGSLCRQNKGNYDVVNHQCVFTPEFCKSIGTCFCSSTKTCFLPTTILEGLSFFFGEGGPREWIHVHGCVSTAPTCKPDTPADYMNLTTGGGFERMMSDAVANQANWGPEFKKQLEGPTNALMFVGTVQGVLQLMGAGPSNALNAAARLLEIFGGSEGASAEGQAGKQAAKTATKSAVRAGLSAGLRAAAAIPYVDAVVMAAVMIAGSISVIVDTANANMAEFFRPTTDGNEYTVGGWNYNNNIVTPTRLGFSPGWLTKPIKYHGTSYTTIDNPLPNVDSFGFGTIPFLDVRADCSIGGPSRCCGSCVTPPHISQNMCYQFKGTSQDFSPMSAGIVRQQPTWIRGAVSGVDNKIWCLPAFPVTAGSTLYDPSIGVAANVDSVYQTNNTWTGPELFMGSVIDPSYPTYPTIVSQKGGDSGDSAQWHYQLVYDIDRMAGVGISRQTRCIVSSINVECNDNTESILKKQITLQSGTCTTGTVCPSSGVKTCGRGFSNTWNTCTSSTYTGNVYSLPTKLWETAYLQKYFSDQIIANMRKYYCNKQLVTDISGSSIDPKCWGYLAVVYQKWNVKPMTISATSAARNPPSTCSIGNYFDVAQNTCKSCPTGLTSTGGTVCFKPCLGNTHYDDTKLQCVPNPVPTFTAAPGAGTSTSPTLLGGLGSDMRLKKNIRATGLFMGLLREYTWEWNDEAYRIGWSHHPTRGILAQEALFVYPEIVMQHPNGYFMVTY
jgi:hypothetical protein